MTEQAPRLQEGAMQLTVGQLVADPNLEIELRRLAGEAGLDRPLRHPRVQKNGLALAGHYQGVVPTRVQLLGETELSYIDALSPEARSVAARGFFSLGLSCVIVTGGREPPRTFISGAEATSTPLFVSNARSSRTINALHALLDDRLAPQLQLHGVLVDVYGVGVLLLGKSGIGKSECALELVIRGHRLVADDVVRCDWRPPGLVFGRPAELLRHHVEIRGLGILDIRELFGVTAICDRKQIDLVVRLCEWDEEIEFDRLGVEQRHYSILGTPVREVRVPVRPGRDMGSIIEMAARNELLRRGGRRTAEEFLERIEGHLASRPALDSDTGSSVSGTEVGQSKTAKSSWSMLSPGAGGTESSAWIPAVRGDKEGKG
ncbi:MAG TPA: HPr(Ser) kinase/phosphatase [Polyangiaceae bacterium]|nr:HPr(Ser) kinase/phosphatase [Polyangiaceae bacterium]